MLMAIFAGKIQENDTILLGENRKIKVRGTLRGEIGEQREQIVYVFGEDGRQYDLRPDRIVGLVHRPVPQVKQSEALVVLETAITAVVGQYVTIKNPDRLPLLLSTLVGWQLSRLPDGLDT